MYTNNAEIAEIRAHTNILEQMFLHVLAEVILSPLKSALSLYLSRHSRNGCAVVAMEYSSKHSVRGRALLTLILLLNIFSFTASRLYDESVPDPDLHARPRSHTRLGTFLSSSACKLVPI